MNILTDTIENYYSGHRISSELYKRSQEYKTLAILRYLYPGKYDSMVVSEKPDLQDSAHGIGIEVTTAIPQEEMRAMSEYCKYCSTHGRKEKEKIIDRIQDTGSKLRHVNLGNKSIESLETPRVDEKRIIQSSIIRKIEKINNYDGFDHLGVALILDIPTKNAEDSIINWIKEIITNNDEKIYDFVYVISHRFCVYFDSQTQKHSRREITKNEYKRLSIIGRMTAEGTISLTNPEWN